MDDDLDLDAAAGLASLASFRKGKPRAPPEGRRVEAEEGANDRTTGKGVGQGNDQRHAADTRDEAIAAAAAATAAQQQVTNARLATATREALCMLGLNPIQHGLVNAVVAAAVSTSSSAFPQTVLLDSPSASACNPVPSFHVYPQASRLSGECSPVVSMVAPSTPAPAPNDLNATLAARNARKRVQQTLTDQLRTSATLKRSLCLRTSSPTKPPGRSRSARASGPRHTRRPRTSFFSSVGETLSKTPRHAPNKRIQPFGFLFTKRWRVIQQECNKFCATLESVKARPMSGIGMQDMGFQALKAFKVQHNGKCFNLSHCFRVIKDEEKFKAQYPTLKSRAGKQAVKEVGDGEKAASREDQLQEGGQAGCGIDRLGRNRGGHDHQEGLKEGEA
ncbi:Lectin-domain containing receptor kinase A4.3 [Hordeum vulgare]|nr:Lectin-domain containing receptor kinase A4.3 [Hordeum vulgare]